MLKKGGLTRALGEGTSFNDFSKPGPDVKERRSSSFMGELAVLLVHGESSWTMPRVLGGLAKPLTGMRGLFDGDSGVGSG
ncbi:hypothetical protein ACLOJK_037038 [Asimina triloba]